MQELLLSQFSVHVVVFPTIDMETNALLQICGRCRRGARARRHTRSRLTEFIFSGKQFPREAVGSERERASMTHLFLLPLPSWSCWSRETIRWKLKKYSFHQRAAHLLLFASVRHTSAHMAAWLLKVGWANWQASDWVESEWHWHVWPSADRAITSGQSAAAAAERWAKERPVHGSVGLIPKWISCNGPRPPPRRISPAYAAAKSATPARKADYVLYSLSLSSRWAKVRHQRSLSSKPSGSRLQLTNFPLCPCSFAPPWFVRVAS